MKRFLILFCTLLTLCAALCSTAAASDFDAAAQELAAIGMFRGTGDSFELDREPTRAEAAVMLVRLYGAEEQAQADYAAGSIAHPFTDVANWTAPYVAWLYTNGLTKGTSDTTFGSADVCTAQNYATFLLRALGYQDGVDFSYKEALAFAEEQGFYNAEAFAGPFLRDDLAALTYQALATTVKSGDTYLLAQLIADGAVDAEAARPMTEKMDAWYALSQQIFEEPTAMECNSVMLCEAKLTLNDTESMTMDLKTTSYMAQIDNGGDIQYAEIITTDYMGVPVSSAVYVRDGWIYTDTSMSGVPMEQYKYRIPDGLISEEDIVVEDTAIAFPSYGGILSFDDIKIENTADSTSYTLDMSTTNLTQFFMELVGDLDIEALGELTSFKCENITVTYTFDANGQLSSSNMSFSVYVETVSNDYGEPMRVSLNAKYAIATTYLAWNEDVTIDFPGNLDNYQEIEIDTEDYIYG